MLSVPLEKPTPDVDEFVALIAGKKPPRRVPFAELLMDDRTMEVVCEKHLGRTWVPREAAEYAGWAGYLDNVIETWYRLGYDYVWTGNWLDSLFPGMSRVSRHAGDHASGSRSWVESSEGPITSWEDYEAYPWPDFRGVSLEPLEYASLHLPEGMGLFACFGQGIFETVKNVLVGFAPLCLLLYEQPELVEALFQRTGETLYRLYERILGLPGLAGFFQGDDMGYAKSTLISPEHIRKLVLPWHKRIARLAHDNGMVYFLHSCGNIDSIMDELIEDVGIDAKHSFENKITPVTEFHAKYGHRIASLGGIDVDLLCRSTPEQIRVHTSEVLDACMPRGRFALGTGNSVADYIPLEHYFTMLNEGLRWSP